MAVGYVNSGRGAVTTDVVSSLSGSFSCTGGANNVLIAFVGFMDNSDYNTDATKTTCTYNGVSMTYITSIVDSANRTGLAVFRLLNPSSGSNTIAANHYESDGTTASTTRSSSIDCVEFDGVDTTTPVGTPQSTDAATTQNFTATVAGSMITSGVCQRYGNGNMTPYTPNTDDIELIDDTSGGAGSFNDHTSYVGRTGATDGSSSYAVGGTTSQTADELLISIEILPSAGGATLDAGTGSFTLTGTAASFIVSSLLAASTGSFATTGQAAALLQAHQLEASAGSFTLTGVDASFIEASVLAAAAGSFSLTGINADLERALIRQLETGAFTIAGQDTAFHAAYFMPAETGAYTLAGQQVELIEASLLPVEAASFSLTGQAANLLEQSILQIESASFTIAGQDLTLLAATLFSAETGTLSLSGQQANLVRALQLDAATGTFTLVGQDLTIQSAMQLATETGSYTINGQALALLEQVVLDASAGTLNINGQSADFNRTLLTELETGSFVLFGQSTNFLSDLIVGVEAGSFILNGQQTDLLRGLLVKSATGNFTVTGHNLELTGAGTVGLETGSFTLSGQSANFSLESIFQASAGTFILTGIDAAIFTDSPIKFLGSTSNSKAGGTGNLIIDISGLGLQAGDIVFCCACQGGNSPGTQIPMVSSGWTDQGHITANGPNSYDLGSDLYSKIMGSTPDTQIELGQPSTFNFTGVVHAFRYVDNTTPLDVSIVTATSPYAGEDPPRPDPPAITPITNDAWVLVYGGACAGSDPTGPDFSDPGYSGGWEYVHYLAPRTVQSAGAYYNDWLGGSYDPPEFLGGRSNGGAMQWASWSIALRPQAELPRILRCATGGFDLASPQLILAKSYLIQADTETFILSGQDLNLIAQTILLASSGGFTINGVSTDLIESLLLKADAGSFLAAGSDLKTLLVKYLGLDAGAFILDGQSLNLLRILLLKAETGDFTLTGLDADIALGVFSRRLWTSGGATSSTLTGSRTRATVVGLRTLASLNYDGKTKI